MNILEMQSGVLGEAAKRGVAWTPEMATSEGFLPAAWYDAQTIDSEDGQIVTSWSDRSGNERHLSGNVTYDADGINGLPCVSVLTELVSRYMYYSGSIGLSVQNLTLIAVALDNGWSQYSRLVGVVKPNPKDLDFSPGDVVLLASNTAENISGGVYRSTEGYVTVSGAVPGEPMIYAGQSGPAVLNFRQNNQLVAEQDVTQSDTTVPAEILIGTQRNAYYILRYGGFLGKIAEVLIYPLLGNSDMLQVHTYLSGKYGITLA